MIHIESSIKDSKLVAYEPISVLYVYVFASTVVQSNLNQC